MAAILEGLATVTCQTDFTNMAAILERPVDVMCKKASAIVYTVKFAIFSNRATKH